ncbi:MAG TPA: hypothetical protein VHO50_12095 [Bacteroidales bacterium]|nr:hypothetical protein [Bacteroidales bacterium]
MKYFFSFLFLLTLLGHYSCTDIFETDLTAAEVELLSPSDGLSTKEKSQRFWWNYVDGATGYEIQIVKPDFVATSSVRLDTTIQKNYFKLSLQPGSYHWRIRAYNGTSTTDYSERTIIIEPAE